MPTSADKDKIGQVLGGSYRIERKIAAGGMGAVYEASQVRLQKKRFAIKLLHGWTLEEPDMYARFRREAEIATELDHPHIVEVLDFNETEQGQPFMVMELLKGEDLAQRLSHEGPLPTKLVIEVAEQVGSALQAAHDHGIVHRDMKPENVFLVGRDDGTTEVKVLDFGISKIKHRSTVATGTDTLLGTPHYMSPEQVQGTAGDVDHTTDIFALGVICYMALSGSRPFDAPSIPGVIHQVCYGQHPPIEEMPRDVNHVLSRAMAKNRADRYQRVTDFVEELGRALTGQPLIFAPTMVEGRPTRPIRPPAPEQRRWLWPVVIAGGIVAAVAAAGVGYMVARKPAEPVAPVAIQSPKPPPPDATPAGADVTIDSANGTPDARIVTKTLPPPSRPTTKKPTTKKASPPPPPRVPLTVAIKYVFVQGPLDKVEVQAALRKRIGDVRGCYAGVKPDANRPSGVISFRLTISPKGAVLATKIMASLFQLPKAEACVQQKARKWQIPPPVEGNPASVMVGFSVSYQ